MSLATAYYHLPGNGSINLIRGVYKIFEEGDTGFLVAAFKAGQKPHIIKAASEHSWGLEEFNPDQETSLYEASPFEGKTVNEAEYSQMISGCLGLIESGELQKAVLSRCARERLPENFEAPAFFSALVKAYPNAFVYLLSVPGYGTWIGATPELLLEQNNKEIHTMALAGTMPDNAEKHEFSAKEIREQELVSMYVQEILIKYCHTIERANSIRQAGLVKHIVTDFTALLKEERAGLELAFALHPTPAVCGTPKESAYNYILKTEPYERLLYSGFLGIVKKERLQLFVNLRCMQMQAGNMAILYAGGGIVEGSDAEKEWEETEKKMDTLRNVLQQYQLWKV